MGLDHPWMEAHPEYFIQDTELDPERPTGAAQIPDQVLATLGP